jgi:hypothetical protein
MTPATTESPLLAWRAVAKNGASPFTGYFRERVAGIRSNYMRVGAEFAMPEGVHAAEPEGVYAWTDLAAVVKWLVERPGLVERLFLLAYEPSDVLPFEPRHDGPVVPRKDGEILLSRCRVVAELPVGEIDDLLAGGDVTPVLEWAEQAVGG